MGKAFLYGHGGKHVKQVSGTFKTDSSGKASVDCGFQPDLVIITKNETHTSSSDGVTYTYTAAIPFADFSGKSLSIAMWTSSSSGPLYDITPTCTATGFSVTVELYDYSWASSTVKNTSFQYIAVKYT